jgi:hypothetical protein
MSVSLIKAGGAFIEFFAQDKTKAGMDKIAGRLRSFSAVVGGIGAGMSAVAGAAMGGFGAALKSFSDFGGGITDSMSRTGMGSDLLQTLSFSAEQAGGNLKDVEGAARTMNKTIAAAAGGNKSAAKNLEALGLSANQLLAMSPDERFKAIADGISKISDPSLKSAAAMKVFGKSATNIMEVLSGGAAGINAAQADLQASGLVLSPDDISNADALGDAWGKLTATMGAAVRLIGAALAPTVTTMITVVQSWVTWITQVMDANRGLIRGIAIAAVVIGGIGTAMVTVAGIAFGLSVVIGAIPAIVAGIGVAFSALAAAVAFFLSPVGLAIAAIVALIALAPAFAYVIDANFFDGKGLKLIISMFSELWRIASATIGGIFNALATGNWGLAANIAFAGLNVAFVTGWQNLKIGVVQFGAWLLKKMSDIFGTELVGKILSGFSAIISLINSGLKRVGLEKYSINDSGLKSLIESAAGGPKEFTDKIDGAVQGAIDAKAAAITDANRALTTLTDVAADEKAKRFAPKAQGGAGIADVVGATKSMQEIKQTMATGASSSAAVARMGFNQPVFEQMVDQQKETNEKLAKIVDNTEDMEPEFE